jgi:hypothetical protein
MVKSLVASLLAIAAAVFLLAQESPLFRKTKARSSRSNPFGIAPKQSKDINVFSKLFAPNMIYAVTIAHLQTREHFFNSVKNNASPLDQLVTEDVIARSFGDSIVVTSVDRGKSTKNDKVTVIRGRFTDTWARASGD